MPTAEQARETKAGPLLDELFCVVCYKWYRIVGDNDKSMTPYWVNDDDNVYERLPPVSTDANACEAWAMRWAREQGLDWEISSSTDPYNGEPPAHWVALVRPECRGGYCHETEHGTDWKEAFVRACVVAAINLAKGT